MRKSYFIFLISLVVFISCSDSTEPDSGQAVEDTKTAMLQMDEGLSVFMNDAMLSMFLYMPDISGILGGNQSLMKNSTAFELQNSYAFKKILKIQNDENPISILLLLSQLTGTFTYVNDGWSYSPDPSDALLIEYDFEDNVDNVVKHAQIKLYNFTTTTSQIGMSVEVRIDGVLREWTNLTVQGSNLLGVTQEPVITQIAMDGGGTTANQLTFTYTLSVTDTRVEVSISMMGQTPLVVVVEGTGFFTTEFDMTGNGLASITRITVTYGALEFVINDITVEEGDIGDINYNGNKVADLVVVDGEIMVQFINGEEISLYELMPSTFNFSDYM